ncbi:MAG: DUF366 family protein [bacterium]
MERSFLEIVHLSEKIAYDGSQLAPHWIYKKTGIMGDAAVCFMGPCDVSDDQMADLEDLLQHKTIKADKMLHFIIELFGKDCILATAIQCLFISEIQNILLLNKVPVKKDGDDLFIGDGKLSISIASVSPVSALIHIGLNVNNSGTPVKTSALEDFGIDVKTFTDEVLKKFNYEYTRIILAASKVRARL